MKPFYFPENFIVPFSIEDPVEQILSRYNNLCGYIRTNKSSRISVQHFSSYVAIDIREWADDIREWAESNQIDTIYVFFIHEYADEYIFDLTGSLEVVSPRIGSPLQTLSITQFMEGHINIKLLNGDPREVMELVSERMLEISETLLKGSNHE